MVPEQKTLPVEPDLEHPEKIPGDERTTEDLEAEAALARIEDRIGAFTPYTLATDLLELREICAGTFQRMKDEDWTKRTERRAVAWTHRQALAHVEAITHGYNAAIVMGLEDRTIEIPGFTQRSQLKEFNRTMIEARADKPIQELIASMLDGLEHAARLAASLEADGLGRRVHVPPFGVTPTVAELFGTTLAHVGIVHGGQLALNRSRPLWLYFQPGMMRRQITRFIHTLGLSYWPERGGDLHATIGVQVAGQGGGSWIVRIAPEGGKGKVGVARTTDVNFSFKSADLFCRVVTYQTRIWREVLFRQLKISGNLPLSRRLPNYFAPT